MEKNQNNLILPKPHISWSQLSCWLSNPTRYRKEYFEAGDKLDTKYLRFGKGIAKVIEALAKNPELKNDAKWVMEMFGMKLDDERVQNFFRDLVIYDSPEFEIKTDVKGVPCLSYIDNYHSVKNVFREDKTGKIAWTKARVIKHGQLIFYATMLKWSGKGIPEYCDLDWIETKESVKEVEDFWREAEKKLDITGRIVSFHREFDEREIEKMEELIVKVANEISEAYQAFLKEI